MKIFLSPSNQTENVGEYKAYGMNECLVCEQIAQAAYKHLSEKYDCEVLLAERTDRMTTRIAKAKEFGANIYVPIHTNAASSKAAQGCEAFYFSTDTDGKKLAETLRDAMVKLGCVKRNIKAASYQELRDTTYCTRAYLEVDFHTHAERTKWLVENTQLIGNTIAETIATHCNLSEKQNKSYTITAILNGLTAEQAEKAKSELEAAGYAVTLTEQIQASDSVSDKTEEIPKEEVPEVEVTVFEKGDKVKLSSDAVVYGTSKQFAAFVYRATLYVREIAGDRVVISTVSTGAVTGAVDKKYLIKV